MIHRYATFIKAVNLTTDYIILNISMFISYFIVDKSASFWTQNKNYLPIVVIFNLIWLLAANLTGLYEQVLNKDFVKTYRGLIKTYLIFVCFIYVTIVVLIGTKPYFITREYLFYSLALFGFLLALWKLIFLGIRLSDRASLIENRNVVIVGGGRIGYDLYSFFKHNKDLGYKLIGFFDDQPEKVKEKNLYLGAIDECINYVIANRIDEIFCTLPNSKAEKIEQLMLDADKNLIRFKFIPQYYDHAKKPTYIQSFGHIPVMSIRPEPLENLLNRFYKRLFDIVFSIFVIVFIFSWLFPILAILIKLESKGPVFFVQRRSGRGTDPFKCYKFRSMTVFDDKEFVQATKNDIRITKVGRIIRKTSLDELPQFFNVILGNMSVVGPRPHALKLDEEYMNLINSYMVRRFVKPGITGWAQIIGLRGETSTTKQMLERVEADVWYLENWSFLLDVKIIFLTFTGIFKGDKNAY